MYMNAFVLLTLLYACNGLIASETHSETLTKFSILEKVDPDNNSLYKTFFAEQKKIAHDNLLKQLISKNAQERSSAYFLFKTLDEKEVSEIAIVSWIDNNLLYHGRLINNTSIYVQLALSIGNFTFDNKCNPKKQLLRRPRFILGSAKIPSESEYDTMQMGQHIITTKKSMVNASVKK